MKKLILILVVLLVGCQSHQSVRKAMVNFYEYVQTCQMEEIALHSMKLDYYYQDCARLLPYVDKDYHIKEIKQEDDLYYVLIENKSSKQLVLWTLTLHQDAFKVISFEFK